MQLTDFFAPKYGKETAEYMFGLLYTIYSLPNIILPLFGGVLTDKYGRFIKEESGDTKPPIDCLSCRIYYYSLILIP
jgi:MFS family permease